jgi:hypothetical protein
MQRAGYSSLHPMARPPNLRPRGRVGLETRYAVSGSLLPDSLSKVRLKLRLMKIEISAVMFSDSIVLTPGALKEDLRALVRRMLARR